MDSGYFGNEVEIECIASNFSIYPSDMTVFLILYSFIIYLFSLYWEQFKNNFKLLCLKQWKEILTHLGLDLRMMHIITKICH